MLTRILKRLLNLILPQRCLKCDEILDADPGLCGPCWSQIRFISDPQCSHCGLPLDFEVGDEGLCGSCAVSPPLYDKGRSVFVYDDASKGMILRFKHGDSTHGAPAFAKWMGTVGQDLLKDTDLIIPVPLHWTRLFTRTYNQAQLMATHLCKLAPHASLEPALLKRHKRTPPQGHLSKEGRIENVKSSFKASKPHLIKGKSILLIDDVLTSGATLNACAKELKKAGAKKVFALTLARVARI